MTNSGLKIIITGATGMVGEGVLRVFMEQPEVLQILLVSRKPSGIHHEKLKEVILKDFFNIREIRDEISGYDACFFCAGISSLGKKEEEYRRITYYLTIEFAKTFGEQNQDAIFTYVSGAGTSPDGKLMWSRVKGET
ncbi:NAD-dependent epimerase/dehydratase family protein [Autumnicola musiva]|uniref:NAD-dependent epimerase/dehydratase family protein n=1 Tax=Autumnicola musiva TaxID=3075589 RepID=A0ABU3D413_9FLAO|nr:NAD-dependent epimerase/dehydratase family protein [Zunongwangia sp. F117]MDT0676274.1 NAD-dependent epimerase/dehydratase family protein [Zunongwangia sp. F117]